MNPNVLSLPPVTWSGAGLGLLVLAGSYVIAVGVLPGLPDDDVGRTQPQLGQGGVGIISIAAGIAFQTVLGNMFAGIIILTRDRFRVGDQIAVGEHRGTVVQMGLTSTSIRTFDGRLVLVPNGTLHSEMVTIQTGFEQVRSAVTIALADTTDLDHARAVALQAMNGTPEVLHDPPPEALLGAVGNGTVDIELRFWSGARQLETREAQHAVIREALRAFKAQSVATGSDAYVIEPGKRLEELLQLLTARKDAS